MAQADDLQHIIICGVIAQMPADDQAKIHEAAQALRKTIAEAGLFGEVALALVGAELAKKA